MSRKRGMMGIVIQTSKQSEKETANHQNLVLRMQIASQDNVN